MSTGLSPQAPSGAPPRPSTRRVRALVDRVDRRFLPVVGTLVTLVVMLGVGQQRYSTARSDFLSMRLLSNLLLDNSYLLVLAVGMTFVVLAGASTSRSGPWWPSSGW